MLLVLLVFGSLDCVYDTVAYEEFRGELSEDVTGARCCSMLQHLGSIPARFLRGMATAVAVAGSDARTGRGMMEEPVGIARWKTFSLDGHHYYYDESRKLQEAHAPCMPPKEMTFNLMFFRHVFDHLAKTSGSGSRVSVVALRNMSARLMEKMQVTDPMNIDFFGDIAKKKCTWNDVCKSLLAVGHPRVSLTPTERLFVTLEAEDSSHIAKVWFYIVMTVTIANVSVFIWPKLLLDAFDVIHISDTDAWSLYFKDACMTAPWLILIDFTPRRFGLDLENSHDHAKP